jgi:D-alanyl-D-alanine carboxypeptidase
MPITLRRGLGGLLAVVLASCLALATTGWLRSSSPATSTTNREARLPRLLDHWRQQADVPAVTLAVERPGHTRIVAASGTGLRDGDTPITAQAQFRVASITKMFVAAVVLQLVEERRLELDAPVSDYVPDFAVARTVTIRQLLNHTSGIPDFARTDHFNQGVLSHRDKRWTSDEILALVGDLRPDFPAGTEYRYSNTGYIVLGKVIEAVTGTTWARVIRRRILDPLHLHHTYIAGFEPARGRVIAGYIDTDEDGHEENTETGRPWPSLETSEGSAGAIVSTAGDLATFGDALFHGRLVRPATLREMVAEGRHHPRNSGYGLGIETYRPDYQLTLWGHSGATLGFRSVLWYAPKHDMVVVVLANDFTANPPDLAELVIRAQS